jgi:hypothetical protein
LVKTTATISNGSFGVEAPSSISTLQASSTPYIVTYIYAGDGNYGPVTDNTSNTLTVNKATPVFKDLATSSSIPYGLTPISLGGNLNCAPFTPALPNGQSVTVEIGTAANPNMVQATYTISSP